MDQIGSMAVPVLILTVSLVGLVRRVDLWQALLDGAEEGLRITVRILPSLIALTAAVTMLRASGVLELLGRLLEPLLSAVGIPPETAGLLLVRPVSGSAALGVGAELIRTYGPDSSVGRTAAVMLGATETVLYTAAVYFGAVRVSRTRYTVPAALCGNAAGFLAAAWTVRLFFGTP